MSINQERKKILNMIAAGTLTAEEAAVLLRDLNPGSNHARPRPTQNYSGSMRIRVTNAHTGKVRVNVNIPLSLVDVGLKMGAKFAPDLEGIDFDRVIASVRNGVRGKVAEVTDNDLGEYIEIYVE